MNSETEIVNDFKTEMRKLNNIRLSSVNQIILKELEMYDIIRKFEFKDYKYFKDLYIHNNNKFCQYLDEFEEPSVANKIYKTLQQIKPRLINRQYVVDIINIYLYTLHEHIMKDRENDPAESFYLLDNFFFYDEHNEEDYDIMEIKRDIKKLEDTIKKCNIEYEVIRKTIFNK